MLAGWPLDGPFNRGLTDLELIYLGPEGRRTRPPVRIAALEGTLLGAFSDGSLLMTVASLDEVLSRGRHRRVSAVQGCPPAARIGRCQGHRRPPSAVHRWSAHCSGRPWRGNEADQRFPRSVDQGHDEAVTRSGLCPPSDPSWSPWTCRAMSSSGWNGRPATVRFPPGTRTCGNSRAIRPRRRSSPAPTGRCSSSGSSCGTGARFRVPSGSVFGTAGDLIARLDIPTSLRVLAFGPGTVLVVATAEGGHREVRLHALGRAER